MGPRLIAWIERQLEQDLRLTVNRTKTRVVRVTAPQQRLDFLGFTLRYFRSTRWRDYRYLTVEPSARAQARLREKLRGPDASGRETLARRHRRGACNPLLRGWAAYFRYGYPRRVFPHAQLLRAGAIPVLSAESEPTAQPSVSTGRESLCGFAPLRTSVTCDGAPSTPCVGLVTTRVGEPDAGNLHVRFDEGERLHPRSLLDWSSRPFRGLVRPFSVVDSEQATRCPLFQQLSVSSWQLGIEKDQFVPRSERL